MRQVKIIISTLLFLISVATQAQIKIGGNVYGGGNIGNTDGSTNVTVRAGDIGRVFGGARQANVASTHSHTGTATRVASISAAIDVAANLYLCLSCYRNQEQKCTYDNLNLSQCRLFLFFSPLSPSGCPDPDRIIYIYR